MSTETMEARTSDPILLAVIANRLDSICREMTNTLLRSARSAVINICLLYTSPSPRDRS